MQTLPCGSLVRPLKHLGTHLTPLALPSGLSHCDPLFLGVSLHSPRRPRPPASECLLDCHGSRSFPQDTAHVVAVPLPSAPAFLPRL